MRNTAGPKVGIARTAKARTPTHTNPGSFITVAESQSVARISVAKPIPSCSQASCPSKCLYTMYKVNVARKGISSLQLAKQLGITQKSAWFMPQRVKEACGDGKEPLSGIVEIDETYIGGLEKNKHESKKLNSGRGTVGKTLPYSVLVAK